MIHKFSINDEKIVVDVNSGAVHKVDNLVYDVLDYYRTKDTKKIIEELKDKYTSEDVLEAISEIKELEDNELLFGSDEYIANLKSLKAEPVIKALCLHISHDCNLRCKYCFASYGHFGGDRGFMSIEVGKKAVDMLIRNSGKRKNLEIDFFGGEPLLNFDTVKAIIEYARDKEKETGKVFKFTITTNAMLIDESIKEYINNNISNVVLSIDGRKSVNDNMRKKTNSSGTYDDILNKITDMAQSRNQQNYYVRGTYTRHNLDFSKDVLHLADLGFKQISVEPVVGDDDQDYSLRECDVPKLKEEYERLANEYISREEKGNDFNFFHFMIDLEQGPCASKRLSGCGAGSEYLAITPTGDIYPCHQFVDNSEFKMGSVFQNEFDRTLQTTFKNTNIYTKSECKNCWAKFYCSGGCHASAHKFSGDLQKPYKIGCELEKKRVECALYIAVKRKHFEVV